MFPPRFRYEAPRTIAEATSLLHEGGGEAKVLAGGQSLVPLLKLRFASPELLVDINNLPDLAYHRVDDSGALHVGALCRHADLEHSTLLAERQPTMIAAAPLIADPIVRTRGTLVGSLCHADPQGDWAAVITALGGAGRRPGPRRPPHDRDRRLRHRAVPEHPGLRRGGGRGDRPGREGPARGRLPQARAPGR